MAMSSSPNLEGLEIKEATPSIAPSIYESLQYTKKWRIILAIGIGLSLIGVCILAFYLSVKARTPPMDSKWTGNNISTEEAVIEPSWQWRTLHNDQCFINSKLSAACPKDFGDNVTLLIAFGGLRPNQVNEIPALSEFIRCGVSASHLVPTYPTSNYTNLYTIATGLYAESHGIISAKMYDPILDMNFTIGTPSAHKSEWWGGEPLWNTAKKNEKQSATYLWPGSDVRIQNRYPSYWQKEEKPFGERIIKVLDWIRLPIKERPELIMMYYNGPSEIAQEYGIFSDSIDKVLRDIGFGMDELITGLEREDLASCVNIVVVSDHGIAPSHCDESIFLDDILVGTNTARVFTGPVGRIMFPNVEEENQVMEKLQCQDKKVRALSKRRVPKRYHYTNNERIGGLVLDTKVGSRVALQDQNPCSKGDFGYNNLEPSMQGIFIAHGPSFKNGFAIESFRNVEIYNLICQLLGIDPAPNNGTLNSLNDILKDPTWYQLNQTLIDSIEEEYLEEVTKSRPLRIQDAVIGIRGIDAPPTDETCPCDPSQVLSEATTTSSISPKSVPTSSEHSPIPELTTTQQSAVITSSDDKPAPPKATEEATLTTSTSGQVYTTVSSVSASDVPSVDSVSLSVPTTASHMSTDEEKKLRRSKRWRDSSLHGRRVQRATGSRNDSVQFTKNLLTLHAPWGTPSYSAPEVKSDLINILPQTSYIIGFPESLNLPVWSSFSLTRNKLTEVLTYTPTVPKGVKVDEENIKEQVPLGCWIADSRLNRSINDQCTRFLRPNKYTAQNISLRQLFPEELELPEELSTEGFLLSNLSPMRYGYEKGGRNAIVDALKQWTLKFGAVNVIHGPVFDYNFDGKRDLTTNIRDKIKPVVASDFFFVVTLCNKTREVSEAATIADEVSYLESCAETDLKTYCFVLPNTDIKDDCLMTAKEYLMYHLSSVWDVQVLTGMKFYKNLPEEEYIRRLIHQPITIPFDS